MLEGTPQEKLALLRQSTEIMDTLYPKVQKMLALVLNTGLAIQTVCEDAAILERSMYTLEDTYLTLCSSTDELAKITLGINKKLQGMNGLLES